MTSIESDPQKTEKKMKRDASGELDGSLQPSEKAAKEGGAGPELVGADPLLELLCTFTAGDKARSWRHLLDERDVCSLDALTRLALDKGWEVFVQELRESHDLVLASELSAWKQGWAGEGAPAGNHFFFSLFVCALYLVCEEDGRLRS